MQIKASTLLESLFILFVISYIGSMFSTFKPIALKRNEIISDIIHTQFQSFQNHIRYDYNHPLIDKSIWFNMSGNVNQANTIHISGTNEYFTIMLHTGRIHD